MILSVATTSMPTFATATRIRIAGQDVTFERGDQGWIATGWQQGLPVARKPITTERLLELLDRFDCSDITFV